MCLQSRYAKPKIPEDIPLVRRVSCNKDCFALTAMSKTSTPPPMKIVAGNTATLSACRRDAHAPVLSWQPIPPATGPTGEG